MVKSRLEWKVGVFALIGLALVGSLLLMFSKGISLFRPSYTLNLTVRNVGGLKPSATVLMAGVRIGSVSDIQLNPSGTNATITLRLYKQFTVHKDARFVIEQSGFLGDQYVAIVPTENRAGVFGPGEHAEVQEPFNLQEVARAALGFIQRVDDTARKLNDAVSDVRRLVLNEGTLTNVTVTVNTLHLAAQRALAAANNVNTLIDANAPSIGLAVSNLVFFSDQVNQFGNTFGGVLTTNSMDIRAAIKNIESSSLVLKHLLEDLQAGRGLAGSVLRDDALAADFQAIADNLSVTSSNLNRLGLWGIMWSRKPPRTNATPLKPSIKLESPKQMLN
jgi:phospholipid/cholesterol/gamma-HCH transport system substrate-binding protein